MTGLGQPGSRMRKPPARRREAASRARPRAWAVTATVWVAALCAGCASLWAPRPVAYENEAVRRLMLQAQTANAGMEGVKGLGRITLAVDGSERIYERTAWVGAEPGRLRFVFRAPTGMPVFSMSCDEQWVTALNHSDGDYYHRRIGGGSLSRFLPVPVTCQDLYGLLLGRPPAVTHDSVRVDDRAPPDRAGVTLLLQRRFGVTVGRLHLAADSGELRLVELLDRQGNPRYEARLEDRQTVDGYRLPTRIRLSGPDGGLTVEAQRLWTAAGVSASLFRIAPPRGE